MSDWPNIESDLFELILQKSEYKDVIRSKAVCRPWYEKVDAYVPSRRSAMAGLIVPSEVDEKEHGRSFQFYHLKNKNHIKLKDMPEEIYNGACFGSSHGWLVFIDSDLNLCLFDPFSKARKQISRPESFPRVHPHNYEVRWHDYQVGQMWALGLVAPIEENRARRFRMYRMNKAALSSNPSLHMHKQDKRTHGLVVVHSVGCSEYCMSQLAYYSFQDEKWTELPLPCNGDGTIEYERLCINDVIWYNGQLYVLVRDDNIEVWDFEGSSLKIRKQIHVGMWGKVYEAVKSLDCVSRSYMVESMGELLIVTRFVQRGRTFLFQVYKLDSEKESVEQVESLQGQAIFLGGNNSESFSTQDLPSCEENSIYFTDECWNGCWCFPTRKHDVGIYNLKEGTVQHWPHLESQFFKEPALWFFSI